MIQRMPWLGVLVLVVFVGGLVLLTAGATSSELPSTQPNNGNVRGWGGMVIQKVDCEEGTLALADTSGVLSNPRNPDLWKAIIVAELKNSVITRERLKGALLCKDLKPYQVVMLTGEVRESHTSWSAQREATANWLVVSAELVTVNSGNVFDPEERTTPVVSVVIREVGPNSLVTVGGLKVALHPSTEITTRNERGLWVQEPLTNQLRPGMKVVFGLTTRPDVEGVFTDKIAITSTFIAP